ncbi:DegT/DnrJ/EryC1/StrS family aminotransferase [Citricoccus muralis]|uniref:Aminotransferase class I/II-fold pyridoxal phosphate-dependent enzyme n=1 Tax=Citricoccus muralis TaxID=169134 RepID=A0ABY8H8B4_9MICC|nr:aminotransferase class I/II-fold pyridoxal phosphate-dependent enzyme [Citricoccus muralis]WFP17156.1 aminotransferase class I/II-fold pyridoxal phosphate-dependent enzyme [Citricoccus muralis]
MTTREHHHTELLATAPAQVHEPIHLSPPDVGETEEAAVLAALRSGWVAPVGPDLTAFETELAQRVGVAHGVALSSGTAGLHLGLLGLGVGPGDVVLTSTLTFAATANAIAYTGAEPYFIDAEPTTGNLDPTLLERALARLIEAGERIGAIVPVDLLGKSADYLAIEAIAAQYGVPVLADAAESLGASYRGRPAGSYGRAAIVSFNGNKIMTTSGGGMFLTDDASLAERVRYLSTQARQPVVHYEHTEIGFNYRMSNVLAALGRAQLSRLDEMIARRHRLRCHYRTLFSGVAGVKIFGGESDADDNAWLTSILVDPQRTGWSADELRAVLSATSIESRPLWKPMHLQPVFHGARGEINGVAERLFAQALTLPSGSGMTAAQRDRVTAVVRAFLEERP